MSSASWQAAESEGLSYFWAHMHTGHTVAFVGHEWADGGFTTDADGDPVCDSRGNTVAKHTTEDLDQSNAAHVAQVEDWYG